ncbi:Tetratricopeptide repeat (TPR)-like superfamily protein [Euphorbia peplus]|nr:Tetratricopeptide repeat (TPR)-like superfamily protein [Euphorbia peplus]
MAVVVGNLALLLDVVSPRTIIPDRKTRPVIIDVVLNLQKRDSQTYATSLANKGFELDGEGRNQRVVARGKAYSKINGVDFDSDEENGNGNENGEVEEGMYDWEKEMRKRVKEVEEMRELEKTAEYLQNRAGGSGGDGDGEDGEETEEEKKMRVRKELEKVAKEQQERRETAQLMFELGQRAYGKGMYSRAIEFLEAALTIIPRPTMFGGEIQIWLAMAYEANNRHKDCIDLYRQLESGHPSISIRRQAAELRYILQAPKLKISQEEMVTIPLIGSSYDSYAVTWTDKNKDKDQNTANQVTSSRDYLADFLVWRPPAGLEKNTTFWIALTLWLGLVGAALFLQ